LCSVFSSFKNDGVAVVILIHVFVCLPLQFLCRKNVKSFLNACKAVFGMKDRDLFEPFDLVETEGFGKVRQFGKE